MQRPKPTQLQKLLGIASYQFGKDIGSLLFDKGVLISCSKRTGRIRHVFRNGRLIATLRPKDGYLALALEAARVILSKMKNPPNLVVVQNEVSEFIRAGGDVFAKHVVRADKNLRPAEEVIVIDENGLLLGVGKAALSANDMKYFKRGVAVKLRVGSDESKHREESEFQNVSA